MNKKLIASLLTLGLVLSPATASLNQSYATEGREDNPNAKTQERIDTIRYTAKDYEKYKNDNYYRLGDDKIKIELEKSIKEAIEYVDTGRVSLENLEKHSYKVFGLLNDLAASSKENQKNLKINIVTSRNLLANNADKSESEAYKKLSDKIDKAVEILKIDNLGRTSFEDLKKVNDELVASFLKARESFDDKADYSSVIDSEYDKLNSELENREDNDKTFENLLKERQSLIDKDEAFRITEAYTNADADKKEAYDKDFKELKDITDLEKSEENQKKLSELISNVKKVSQDIGGKDTSSNTDHQNSGDEKKLSVDKEIKELREYIFDMPNINAIISKDSFKNKALGEEYNKEIQKAMKLAMSEDSSIELKTYQDAVSKLKDLTDKIKAEDKNSTETEKSKLDILKEDLKKAEEFRSNPSFMDEPMEKQGKLNDAILSANELLKKEKITDEEAEKASKALNEALKIFTNFKDTSEAKAAIKGLLDKTVGINIERFYGEDQKEAKETYAHAKETASKLVDKKDAKLEELDKAYKDFKNSIDRLATFLTSRIQKILDEDKNFRDSEKYKALDEAAKKNNKQDPAIINYIDQIGKAQSLLKESEPDANKLDDIYKKLLNAKSEIKGDMSAGERKLTDAIIDGYAFMETEKYKNAAVSKNKNLKDAAENYKLLLETAETYEKSGNFESQEAKDLMDALVHARGLLEGKISEKEYLSNKYYHILKTLSKHKGYKEINQVSRKKLEGALKLYEESSDREAIFKALDEAMNDDAIKDFIKKIEEENNPSLTRDKLLEDLTTLINEDKKLKEGGFKYQKAQKALRDAYDLALKEANELIGENKNPTEEEVRAAYKKLLNAKNSLDGDKFSDFIQALAQRFKKDQLKIANPDDRKAIAAKINALSGEEMTMDDALKVEKELNELINKKVVTTTTTTLAPQAGAPTTTRPISTITNPGSSVRTGIKGVAKVAVVLVAALGIYKLISKKGDKNETN